MSYWLTESGHSLKAALARWSLTAAILVSLLMTRVPGWVRSQFGADAGDATFLILVVAFFALLLAPLVVRPLIRCRVCGLHVLSSAAALAVARSRRDQWLQSLDSCPVCHDDGHATAASQARWLASGQQAEPPYWSTRKIILAILLAAIIGGGCFLYAVSYRARPSGTGVGCVHPGAAQQGVAADEARYSSSGRLARVIHVRFAAERQCWAYLSECDG